MNRRRLAGLLLVCCAWGGGAAVHAEEPSSWKGELVVGKKHNSEIKFGNRVDGKEVFFEFAGIYPIKVREDREGWLHLFDGHREGWADKDQFVLSRDATAYFTDRLGTNPSDRFAWWGRGEAWLNREEYDNAIKDFTECIRLDPKNAHAFNNRGIAWRAKKEYDKAIRDYDEAVRLDPKNALAFNNRGNAWFAKKDYDKAIRDYDEAVRLDPKYAWAFNNRGLAWYAKKEYDKAIRDYDEAVRLDPKYAQAFYNRSVAQMLSRQPKAVGGFQTVLDLQGWKGDRALYAVILGHFAARQDEDEAAAKRFLSDSAGKLSEDWPYPVVRFLRGEIDEPALLKLAIDDDKRTEARCYLGLDHLLKGRKDEALAHFRWVKEHGTATFTEYNIAIAELERLERGEK